MPVYEVQDAQGRTMTLEGDHEPTPDELEPLFKSAFSKPAPAPAPDTSNAVMDNIGKTMAVEKGAFLPAFQPFEGAKKLIDKVIPSFVPETPEMAQLVGMAGLGNAQAAAAGVSERLRGAAYSVASPGGVMLGVAAPMAPEVVGPVMATTVAPQAIEGVKELARGETAVGLTDIALAAPVVVGGVAAMVKAAPASSRALGATVETLKTKVEEPAPVVEAAKPVEPVVEPAKSVEAAPASSVETPPTPETPPIGITPSSRLSKFIDLMMPRESTTPPPIELKPGERLPVPRPFEEAKQIFVQPFGMGKLPVLGVVMDANARVRTPVQESVNAYYANNFGVRPAVSSAFGKEIQGTIDPFFDIDPATSVIKNIKPAREGLSLHVSDVLENLQRDPESYVLSPEQRTAFERIQQHMAEIDKLEQEAGVKKLLTDDEAVASEQLSFDFLDDQRDPAYFPRIVTKRPKEPPVVPARQGGMGAKQFFQKTRIFNSEAEGVAAGYRYEPSIEKRLTTRVDRTYKAIFDKQFAEDPALGARSVKEVRAEVIRDMEDRVASGERTTPFTEEQLDAVVQGKVREGAVHQPGMAGKVFDPEVAAVLNKSLPRSSSELGQRFQSFNNVARELTLAGDLSSLFIQLLPSAYRNPVIWSRAAYNSIKALGDPRVHDRFMKDHIESVRELAQLGSSVGRREELLAGGGEKSLVERIPGVRRLYRPFLRQFETSLDTAKVLLWEAWKDVAKPEERLELARTLESQLGIGRVESAAIKHNQAFVERATLLASSMYRGFLNYLAAVGQRGIAGKVARQGMGAFMAGAAATYVGVGLALGMSMDDIKERFNPARGDFMMWPVKVGGRTVNIGFGGFYKSLMRLAGNVYKTSIEHPGNWLSLAPDKNPFTRWWRSHASLPVGLAWNQFTGQDFLGGDTDITEIMPSLAAPLSSRETRKYLADKMAGRKTDDTLGQVATESLVSFIGLSAWPESKRNQLARTIEDDAVERFNKPYDQLTLGEQRQVAKAVQALPEFKTKQEPTKREREAAFQADIDRVIRVRKALPEPLLDQLDKLEVKVRGFDPAITLDGVKIPLSRKQSEAYEQFIKEEYARMIPKAMPAILKQAKPEVRQKIMDQTLTAARELARSRLAKMNRKE